MITNIKNQIEALRLQQQKASEEASQISKELPQWEAIKEKVEIIGGRLSGIIGESGLELTIPPDVFSMAVAHMVFELTQKSNISVAVEGTNGEPLGELTITEGVLTSKGREIASHAGKLAHEIGPRKY